MTESAYTNHAVRATLKQLLDLQGDDELAHIATTLPSDQKWQLDRAFEVTRYVQGVLESTPSTLASMLYVNNLQSGLTAVLNELTNFKTNKNPGHLTNASNHIDQTVIPALAGFLPNSTTPLAGKGGEIIDDLRSRSRLAVEDLTKEKTALDLKLTDLNTLIAAQDRRLEELSRAVDVQKKEAVAVAAEVRGEYAKTEKELRGTFDTSLAGMQENFQSFAKTSAQQSELHLKILGDKEIEARKIVQVVGNIGVTGNYQKIAQSESNAANVWRRVTIGFFAVGVAIALSSFIAHILQVPSPENFWTFAMRFVTALAIASPALYTARESARHRTMADRARQRELELASLGPFIELLPGAVKEQIRAKLVERYFGSEVEAHEVKAPIDPKDVMELAGKAVEGLVKAAKKD